MKKITVKLPLIVISIILMVSCATLKTPKDASIQDYFFVSESNNVGESNWVVFLPGTSGLTIFKDSLHYINLAKKLNQEGYNVVLVDYKKAYKASKKKVDETTGEKINWVLEKSIEWTKKKYGLEEKKITIVGWSLAGEGLSLLANDTSTLDRMGIAGIAMFYPSNQSDVQVNSSLPILIQVGDLDEITPANKILKDYSNCVNAEILILENAFHGFDVESLGTGKSFRFPPIFGKKHTMKYSSEAAKEANNKLIHFLNTNK
jgi:dienelactone hydrolase